MLVVMMSGHMGHGRSRGRRRPATELWQGDSLSRVFWCAKFCWKRLHAGASVVDGRAAPLSRESHEPMDDMPRAFSMRSQGFVLDMGS